MKYLMNQLGSSGMILSTSIVTCDPISIKIANRLVKSEISHMMP